MNFIHKPLMSGIAICLTFFAYSCATPEKTENKTDFTAYVDPYIGSGEHGHVFVGANVPFGAVQVGPQNIFKGWDWCSGYHYSDSIIIGFSHTHLSGTGCSDLGDILLMPYTGEVRTARGEQDNIEGAASSYYKHANEAVAPGYYSLLMDNGVKAELTATERVALHRYTYPSGSEHRLLINLKEGIGDKAYDTYLKKIDEYTIEGYRFSKGWSPRHKVFFTLKCDQPIESLAVFNDDEAAGNDELTGESVKGVITFKGDAPTALVKVAISSVSCENALANLRTELSHWDFDEVRNEAIDKWNDQLSCISIDTKDERAKKIFYTAMYHLLIHPNIIQDVNGEYPMMESLKVGHTTGNRYTVFSLWDTYRNVSTLMTLLYPEKQLDIIRTMIDMYKESGWLPKWELYGRETLTMEGDPSIPYIVDAYMRGLRDYDIETAYEGMRKGATTPGEFNLLRPDNNDYMSKGYVPLREQYDNSVSHALEYYIADWNLSLLADALGKKEDAKLFRERAMGYKHYYCKEFGTLRPILPDGTFYSPFDPKQGENFEPSPGFHEGNAWNYTFYVPHDIKGLAKLMGGQKRFVDKLQMVFDKGYYDMANEPDIAYPYLFSYFKGEAWRTQKLVRELLGKYYHNAPNGLPGNDDTGTMSTWAIFSMMGFYPACPGDLDYVVTSPTFNKVTIRLDEKFYPKGELVIESARKTPEDIYIKEVTAGGKKLKGYTISQDELVNAGTLRFTLENKH